mgnify:FL=1|tara:strand:- start:41 stop:643 length:603 start_codon:yes stop_codon:yes gene_type:complete
MSEVKTNKVSPVGANGTVTLGDSGDTITIPAGATITNSGTATGFGKVLQVVNAIKSDTNSTTSNSAVTTGLEASITPSATSSKVLVLISFAYQADSDTNSIFQLYRDSTAIHLGDAAGSRERASAGTVYQMPGAAADVLSASINCLDSPSSTSSITYKLMFFAGRSAGSNPIYLNRGQTDTDNDSHKRAISSITLMEIEG